MRKTVFPLLLLLVSLLTGCRDSTELGNRAVVQALSLDYAGKYRASVLVFSGGGSGGDTVDASLENVIKVTGEGETLAEAIDNISIAEGKKLYMCETKLLILGGGFGMVNAANALDTLYYDLRCSLNMPVCCCENAELLTELHFREGITSAEKPLSIIENANEKGVSPKTTLLDLLSAEALGKECLIPFFKPATNGWGMTDSEEGDTAVICGSRRFENGLLGEVLDEKETAGEMLLTGKTDRLPLNYFVGGREGSCIAYCVNVEKADGEWIVTAKFKGRNGGALSEEEEKAALNALAGIVKNTLSV